MDDILEQLNSLSPERRKLLAQLLKKKNAAPPEEIARRDEAAVAGSEAEAGVPRRMDEARRTAAGGQLPLSFAQQRLWFFQQLEPDSPYYNMPFALRLQGRLDLTALEGALGEVVRRHEALRTTFASADGQPVQLINAAEPIRLAVETLPEMPVGEREFELRRRLEDEAARPFDLSRGPLLRTLILRTGADEHVALFTIHHIISDGWSLGVLVRELTALYDAFTRRQPANLPDLPFQYADYAIWQREWLRGEVLERQLSYWKQQLAGAPQVLELPTDRPRPALQSYRGATISFVIARALADALRELSRREDATLFMLLLAAWQTLLSRYAGQPDVCVGTPIAGRHRGQTEELIGLFINTLVLRSRLDAEESFRDLLRSVRRTALDAYAHQDLPFEKLVEELQPARSLSYSPLFQVMFISQNTRVEALELPGLRISPLAVSTKTTQFDLTLAMQEMGDIINVSLEYSTALFDATTMERLAANFQTLLAGIVADPSQPVATLPLLSEAERRQLLLSSNTPQADYRRDACIHHLFEGCAARVGDARLALIFEGQQLTYAELNGRANRLAHYLRERGVGPEVLVGLLVERSIEMVVALLGILKTGGAYVPLDPTYPPERLDFMLQHSRLGVLITQQHLLSGLGLRNCPAQIIYLDADDAAISARSATNPRVEMAPANLAYVLYTSGSTGQPKGVQIPHSAVVNFLHAVGRQPGIGEHDVLLAVTSISFDIAALELYLPLTVGARLLLAGSEASTDAAQLQERIDTHAVSIMQATPATWRMLVDAGWQGRTSLRILCGGEALPTELARALLKRGAEVWNMYGPTEATIWSSVKKLEPTDARITIGHPLANLQHYVLDAHLQPVPVGVAGELHIGGDGVGRGYLRRPGNTAEKFIPDPFAQQPGARLYRTGDLARYLPSGEIEVLGRADYQVKVRGYRIELGEIEAVLRSHEAVRACVVVARTGQDEEQRLIAYVIAAHTTPVEEWRRHLAAKLPAYMIPNAFVTLDELPLTPNRKVDRGALPAPEPSMTEARAAFIPPRDSVELHLAAIWESVLGVRPIGVRDNFFTLGGHSLQAVRLMARCQRLTGVNLPLSVLFQQPTIEHLARLLRQRRTGHAPRSSSLVPLQTGGARPPFFCVHPSGGNVLCYTHLARHLGSDQPFYGFQSAGLEDEQPLLTTIEEMAMRYLEELRAAQPSGPYLLGGWSMGGLVALEMARQLQARGDAVALLALIDTAAPAPGSAPTLPDELALMAHFALDMGMSPESLAELGERAAHIEPEERLAQLLELAKAANLVSPDIEPQRIGRLFRVFKTNLRAMLNYTPRSWQGRVALLTAQELGAEMRDADAWRWSELAAGGVEHHTVPGNHFTMLREPYVRTLAEQLAGLIHAARSGNQPQ